MFRQKRFTQILLIFKVKLKSIKSVSYTHLRAERKEWKSDTKVLKKQVQYARKNHVDGFAFFDYQDLKSKTSAKAVNQLKTVLK